ncbi:MAG: WYL domain-containing protein [Candidatus Nanopelagicales bacterium]|nr:WYL domain-containing protein [Candidatus Nanopelagicales bacterium]
MSKSKTERLLALSLALLNASRALTRSEIRTAVRDYPADANQEAFERMFERDKSELRSMGIPIESVDLDSTEGTGYRVERAQAYLQPIEITAGERIVLAMASRMWGEASWGHGAVTALRKLELVGEFSSDDTAAMAVSVKVNSVLVSDLLDAVSDLRAVRFAYQKAGEPQPSTRHVQPWGVVTSRGQWYLVGFDTQRQATRAFRLSRVIGAVKVSDARDSYQIPDDVDLQEQVRSTFPPAETVDVTVAMVAGHAVALRDLIGCDAQATTARIEGADPAKVAEATLAAGEYAQVLEPASLRRDVQAALTRLATQPPVELTTEQQEKLAEAAKKATRRAPDVASAQLSRVLALVPWLIAHGGATYEQASARFETTPEQLRADLSLAVCTEFGINNFCLDIDIWSRGLVVHDPQGIAQPLRLTSLEAVSLLLGLRMLGQLPGSHDNPDLASAIAKVEAAAGEFTSLTSHVALGSPISQQTAEDIATSSTLETALTAGHAVYFIYRNASRDDFTKRTVDPIGMLTANGHAYLQGWCRRAEAVRLFRVDHIESVRELAEDAVVPDSATQLLTSVRPQGPRATVVLAPSIAWWADQDTVTARITLPDGSVAVRIPVASEQWLIRAALSFGGRLRIAEPTGLAHQVRDVASKAQDKYST